MLPGLASICCSDGPHILTRTPTFEVFTITSLIVPGDGAERGLGVPVAVGFAESVTVLCRALPVPAASLAAVVAATSAAKVRVGGRRVAVD